VSLWERAAFHSVRGFCWAFAQCFSFRGLYLLGQFFGTLEWLVNYKRRGRYVRQLRRLLGADFGYWRRQRVCRRFFVRSRCDKIFYLVFDKIPPERALRGLEVRGEELLSGAVERGRGCLVTMSHHGAHHVSAMLMALKGYRLAGVRDRHEGGMRRFVQELYDRRYPDFGRFRVIFADAFPREIYRCLEDNYTLAAALDAQRQRGQRHRAVPVRLFGQEQEVLAGAVEMALRCGSTVLQAFVICLGGFRYRIDLLPLARGEPSRPTGEELQTLLQAYADNVERYVRRYPCHLSRA